MKWLSIRKTISDVEINEIEKDLGIILPKDYKDIIGKINGGALKDAYVEHIQKGRIAYSRNVSLAKDAKANVFTLLPVINKAGVRYFPVAEVGNGDYFCLDLEKKVVVLYVHELDEFGYVCDTFEELLGMVK